MITTWTSNCKTQKYQSVTLSDSVLHIVLFTEPFIPMLYITGERSVFCVTEFGSLKFMMKLEYSPRCMKCYATANDNILYMIATHTRTLMIYNESALKWAAQLSHTPVHIDMCSVK